MPINVVCPGCKKRFKVSDKYAGQKGPCPQCKTVIEIPEAGDEVVVHAPEAAGPTDSKGRQVLKPILRAETRFSVKIAAAIGGAVVVVAGLAALVGSMYEPDQVPMPFRAMAVIVLAPPLVLGGYSVLRNDELEPFRGRELAIRVGICAAVYAFLWGVYWAVPKLLGIGVTQYTLIYLVPPLVLVGAFAVYASLDIDYFLGLFHYGFYLLVTGLIGRLAGVLPFKLE